MNIPCTIGGPAWGLCDWAEIHQWRDCFRGQVLTLRWGNRFTKEEAILSAGLRSTNNLDEIEHQMKFDAKFSKDKERVKVILSKFQEWRRGLD